jgi:hypothetical protein
MLQESTKQHQDHISNQGKYLIAPKLSHRNLPRFLCQNRTVVRPFLPRFPCPQSAVQTVLYSPKTVNRKLKSASKSTPKITSIFVPNPYGYTDCIDLYSTTSHNRKIFQQKFSKKKKTFSRNVPSLLLTFLSQACSENLTNSLLDVLSTSSRCLHHMSCTLPNAFFYNPKMTFPPKSVFSPSQP